MRSFADLRFACILSVVAVFTTQVPAHAQASASSLPIPWSGVSALTPAQIQAIQTVLHETEENIEAQRRAIHAFVVEQHVRSGTPQLVAVDEDLRTRNLGVLARRIARARIEQLLSPDQIAQARAAWSGVLLSAAAPNFQKFQAEQQTALWCWAAVIQMLYNYNGISAEQADIVTEIKGSVVFERATVDEIAKGVTSWRVDPKNPVLTWSASCEYTPGSPPTEVVVGLLQMNRIVLIAIDDEHLGVVHQVSYHELPTAFPIDSATMFDPATGVNSTRAWSALRSHITGWWNCWAVPSRDRVF